MLNFLRLELTMNDVDHTSRMLTVAHMADKMATKKPTRIITRISNNNNAYIYLISGTKIVPEHMTVNGKTRMYLLFLTPFILLANLEWEEKYQ
ncbi:hypothetical protein ECG_04754 [Echinococcus granulosus]|uniref:Expressed protein n=1 Tax=Echinococcus granulosus TaxID=6210 RepID=A0A068WH53_ECHGR|nr:hypothetical protein ECG_04754 [Echinococcus granulosus]CDS16939.1 expressed protein [Echinococcus granulosus]